MTLRAEIHMALDAVAPPTGGMAERVLDTVRVEARYRRRREGVMFRLRAPLALVAVFVVVAIVTAVLAGGRLIAGWNSNPKPQPAGPVTFESQVADLYARQVNLTLLQPGARCPWGPGSGVPGFAGGSLGSGPIRGYVGNGVARPGTELPEPAKLSASGWYFAFNILTRPSEAGPILVRGRELRDGRTLLFPGVYSPNETVAQLTAHSTAFVIDTRQEPFQVTAEEGLNVWYTVAAFAGQKASCIGFQVDTEAYGSQTFVFDAASPEWDTR